MNDGTPALGFTEENGVVTIRITRADYGALLVFLGVAGAQNGDYRGATLRLANRISAGNGAWTDYAFGPGAAERADAIIAALGDYVVKG